MKLNEEKDSFFLTIIKEKNKLSDEIRKYLSDYIFKSKFPITFLDDLIKILPWDEKKTFIQDFVKNYMKNRSEQIKRGEFGEILTSLILKTFYDLKIPIEKLHYMTNKKMSMHGVDVFAFKIINNKITKVYYIESKVRTTPVSGVLTQSCEELQQCNNLFLTQNLLFYGKTLQEQISPYYQSFLKYCRDRKNLKDIDSFKISLIIEDSINIDTELKNLIDFKPNLASLHVIVVRIEKIIDLINSLYKTLGLEVENDDGE